MSNRKRLKRCHTSLSGRSMLRYIAVLRSAIVSTTSLEKERLLGALRARRFDLLLGWAELVSPQQYGDPTCYFVDAQLAALIKKYPFTSDDIPGLNPEKTARDKFLQAEHRCKRQNQKRQAMAKNFDHYFSFWEDARLFVSRILGATPDFQAVYDECDFTSGASLGVHGNSTNVASKLLASEWSCTPPALFHAKRALWSNIHIRDCILPGAIKCYDPEQFGVIVKERIASVSHNKISFVPKTARTHRSIAVEPLLNGFVQKGIDNVFRKALKNRAGIDLSNQTVNQAMSLLGSQGGHNPYVTIDLSAASDSLSVEVVRSLLPPAWYAFLEEVRSPWYELEIDGVVEKRRYEKFCSMGNGFCFPLQTLLFSSVCFAATRSLGDPQDFTVYGDDIVVRQNVALLVIELLRELGFRTNVDKTFVTGPFRESCGSDWFSGRDVRPAQFTKPLDDIREVFALHNSFLRSPTVELFFDDVRPLLRAMVPEKFRFLRPGREPGDTCFSVPLDVAMTSPF